MHLASIFVVFFISGTLIQDVRAKEEYRGIELSVHDWYPNSFPVEAEKVMTKTDDIRCNLITSFVKAALIIKRIQGSLTKDQEAQAIRHFDACKDSICLNSAMIDKFMRPETFEEQIRLLVIKVNLTRMEDDKLEVFRLLANQRFSSNLRDAGELFPVLDSMLFFEQRIVVAELIHTVCDHSLPKEALDDISPAHVSAAFVAVLVEKYTADVIKEDDLANLLRYDLDKDARRKIWENIAEKILSPGSNLATTCLDPSIAYYDTERASITKIREIAKELGVMCDPPAPEPEFELEFSFEAAPPPSSNIVANGGAPGSTINTGGAPGSTINTGGGPRG